MFKRTRSNIAAAFNLFIESIHNLTHAVADNTIAVNALREEQKSLKAALESLVADSNFMVSAKKRELQRAGHTH